MIRTICKFILQYYLKIITKIVLYVHRPKIIVVAGSVNKTFVRDAVRDLLHTETYHVRSNPRNFNTEIGLPLAILNIDSGYNSYRRWIPVMRDALCAIWQKNFSQCLVLELGVSKRGDMQYLMSLVSPHITVITEITQRYIESFSGMDHMVGEYAHVVKKTQRSGCVLLNWDNARVRALRHCAVAPVIFFGFEKKNVQKYGCVDIVKKDENGMHVKMHYNGKMHDMQIVRFGQHHAIAALIAWIIAMEIKK